MAAISVEPCTFALFGALGDLALRKLFPALYQLDRANLLHPDTRLLALAREAGSAQEHLNSIEAHLRRHVPEADIEPAALGRFLARLSYQHLDFLQPEGYQALAEQLPGELPLIAYFATAAAVYGAICENLDKAGLAPRTRVVLEKPIGHDLESSRRVNDAVARFFPENRVYRIDHYLGKETVQNLLALRFANQLFEPIWNSQYIDHVQITMAEDIGIGSRAGYFDGIGTARDVIQNHLLQLFALTAMEEPASFEADDLRMEKEKVLRSVVLADDLSQATARGQYAAGWRGGEQVGGFLEEDGISPDSTTETYAAIRLDLPNRRWAGTPFYLRAGKRLGRRVTEIALVFKKAPSPYFQQISGGEVGANALVIRVQPDEGVTLRFGSKVPGTAMEVRDVTMDFAYGNAFTESSPEAYERLILDVLLGDPPLFPRQEEVALSWKILDPITEFWATQGQPEQYGSGTWGPAGADAMLARDGRVWRRP